MKAVKIKMDLNLIDQKDAIELPIYLRDFYEIFKEGENQELKIGSASLMSFWDENNSTIQELINYENANAFNYNIFEILKIQSLEARVHSPFLVNLLNTSASHGMGSVFLHSFLEIIGITSNERKPEEWKLIEIRDEMTLDGDNGRADIFIRLSYHGKEFGIIIENKIYAIDQKGQLERYYRFLKNEAKYEEGQFSLIYLTPFKSLPSRNSISDEMWDEVMKNVICLGYKKDIASWLSKCLIHDLPNKVQIIINQYLSTIKKF